MNTVRCRPGSRRTAATQLIAPLARQQQILGRAIASPRRAFDRVLIAEPGVGDRHHPAGPAHSGLLPIEAAVDQNPRQPDLERQVSLKRRDMRVRLDEGVLHRFVCVGCVAQIVPGNARRPALLACDNLREQIARGVRIAGCDEVLHLRGQLRLDLHRPSSIRRARSSSMPTLDGAGSAAVPAII